MTDRFPCKISAAESQGDVSLEWTIELVTPDGGCFAEFDAVIDADYMNEEGGVAWEVSSITVECFAGKPYFKITAESDPEMWAILKRCIMADYKAIDEAIADKVSDYAW
jgi:hypothetical protein